MLSKSIPAGLVFLTLTGFSVYFFYNSNESKQRESLKFLGDYRLERLDAQKCDSCKVRLYEDYSYDILVRGKIVGHGKWTIESAIDIPGYFLKIENGPNHVIWEQDRLIESIDRSGTSK